MRKSIVVAMARNGVIGVDNRMPWHLPADLAHFKQLTLGHSIVMGRKTFESIGRPLPGRRNLVITRNATWQANGCETFASLEAALKTCSGEKEVFIIGGGAIYQAAMPLMERLYVTEIEGEFEGDTTFLPIEHGVWKETSRTHRVADEKNIYAMNFVVYDKY